MKCTSFSDFYYFVSLSFSASIPLQTHVPNEKKLNVFCVRQKQRGGTNSVTRPPHGGSLPFKTHCSPRWHFQKAQQSPRRMGSPNHMMEFTTITKEKFHPSGNPDWRQQDKKTRFQTSASQPFLKGMFTVGKKNAGKGGSASCQQATLNSSSWINMAAERRGFVCCHESPVCSRSYGGLESYCGNLEKGNSLQFSYPQHGWNTSFYSLRVSSSLSPDVLLAFVCSL